MLGGSAAGVMEGLATMWGLINASVPLVLALLIPIVGAFTYAIYRLISRFFLGG